MARRLRALYLRHESLVTEMTRRGYRHATPLDEALATGCATQDVFVDPPGEQVRERGCGCPA